MFERYTQDARKVIFSARQEAVTAGSPYIETEHLLLGILEVDTGMARQLLGSDETIEALRTKFLRPQPLDFSLLPIFRLATSRNECWPMPRRRASVWLTSISAPNIFYWVCCANRTAGRLGCCMNLASTFRVSAN